MGTCSLCVGKSVASQTSREGRKKGCEMGVCCIGITNRYVLYGRLVREWW